MREERSGPLGRTWELHGCDWMGLLGEWDGKGVVVAKGQVPGANDLIMAGWTPVSKMYHDAWPSWTLEWLNAVVRIKARRACEMRFALPRGSSCTSVET